MDYLQQKSPWGAQSGCTFFLDPPTCIVTSGLVPHLNNEVIGIAQGFSVPAVEIFSSGQDGVTGFGFTFPHEVTKRQNYEIVLYKTLDIRQQRRDERPIKGAPATALTSSPGRVARPWEREGGGT